MDFKIDRLLKNYENARRSWECWCFMVNFGLKKPNAGNVEVINNNPLLYHLRYLAMKDFYIEAYKILKQSANNKDNIFSQLHELASKEQNKREEVEECLRLLDDQKATTTRICDLRDKFYAHLDKDYESYVGPVNVPDIVKCFVAIERAIVTLASTERLEQQLNGIPSRDEMKL